VTAVDKEPDDTVADPVLDALPTTAVQRAWVVAGVTFGVLVAAAAFRSSTGVLIEPIEATFGWSRAVTSGAVALNLAMFGLVAPFAAAMMERFGLRRVAVLALLAITAGTAGTLLMTRPWHLVVLWGLVVGGATGSLASVVGPIVANRWFVAHRGLVTGLFSAGTATGQLVFLPVVARLATDQGWRAASLVVSGLAVLLVPLVVLVVRDRPADLGLLPYGASGPDDPRIARPVATTSGAVANALGALRRAVRVREFQVLAFTFFVCGWSTNGLVGTHFVAAAHDHGMPATTAAGLLALVGGFDLVGTVASGWLSDRVDPRYLLLAYYGLRGVSLLAVPAVLGPRADAKVLFFIVFYGLDWIATVPPTVALCREAFGVERSGVVYGWVFASHMVGAAVAAQYAGAVRAVTGEYTLAWWTAGALCLVASAACLLARRRTEPVVV
jgi:MFS family permease